MGRRQRKDLGLDEGEALPCRRQEEKRGGIDSEVQYRARQIDRVRERERQRESARSSRSARGDSRIPAGSKNREDGDPTRSVQGGGGKNTWEDSQVPLTPFLSTLKTHGVS